MPYRRKRSAFRRRPRAPTFRKRFTKRRFTPKKNSRAKTLVLRGPTGLPDRMCVKLRFREQVATTITAGVPTVYFFSGNSLFDPNTTGSGHQPYYFDQWATLYGFYRVLGSSCSLMPISDSAVTNAQFRTSLTPRLSTATGNIDQFTSMEAPYCKYTYGNQQFSERPHAVRNYMSTAKVWGERSSTVKSEDNYQAAITASPSDQWYWQCITWLMNDASSLTLSTRTEVVITYYAEFTGRIFLGSD